MELGRNRLLRRNAGILILSDSIITTRNFIPQTLCGECLCVECDYEEQNICCKHPYRPRHFCGETQHECCECESACLKNQRRCGGGEGIGGGIQSEKLSECGEVRRREGGRGGRWGGTGVGGGVRDSYGGKDGRRKWGRGGGGRWGGLREDA